MSKKENEVLEKNSESELVYDGYHKIEKITRKGEEKDVTGEVIKKGNSVCGLIYDTKIKKYIFIEDYKLAANGVTLEAINGLIEPGEKPEQTIKRLVTEKTGYKVDESTFLTNFFLDSNNSDEVCFLYLIDVSSHVIDDLDFKEYKLVPIERFGLGGKLYPEDPVNLMKINLENKKEKIKEPFQCVDVKTLVSVMWVENNNILKEMAELITNSKIRSL